MYKVLISDKIPDSAVKLLHDTNKYAIDICTSLTEQDLINKISAYHAIIIRSATKLTSVILDSAKNLKVIGRAGSGLDNIDVSAAKNLGIAVFNTPGSNSQAVAELTLALIFCLSRNLYSAFDSLKNNKWNKSMFVGAEINGKALGLIGFGQIGQKVGAMASGLGMRILVHKKQPLQRSPGYEFEMQSIDELLKKSDFISLHLPKTEQTTQMFGRDAFIRMKPTAYLINCARGGIINEDDLLKALNENRIAGAALDVFEKEPPYDYKLIKHPNVIATPHLGGSTVESQERVGEDIVKSVMEYLETNYVFL
jgi:D-3-phosphoglycerate dehydrogenase